MRFSELITFDQRAIKYGLEKFLVINRNQLYYLCTKIFRSQLYPAVHDSQQLTLGSVYCIRDINWLDPPLPGHAAHRWAENF